MKFVLVVLWYYGYKGGAAMHSIEFNALDACQKAQTQIVEMLKQSGKYYATACVAKEAA